MGVFTNQNELFFACTLKFLEFLSSCASLKSMFTRRQFLFSGFICGAAAVGLPSGLGAVVGGGPDSLDNFGLSEFSRCIGAAFKACSPAGVGARLELVAVRAMARSTGKWASAPDAENEKFSLHFRGVRSAALTQGTYTFENPELGRSEIFIVPVGPATGEEINYEAVYNRPPRNQSILT